MKAKKPTTTGTKIADRFYPEGTMSHALQASKLSRAIDAAIRAARRQAWIDGNNHGKSHNVEYKDKIYDKFWDSMRSRR